MNDDARRFELLKSLRDRGVTDDRVLDAIASIPRQHFVPARFQDYSWDDTAIPIELGQTISQPQVVGLMTQALDIDPRHKVLEIGTGSGYQAAILSRLCRRVYSIERLKPLLLDAELRFQQLKLHNITTRHGDGTRGWAEQAPFERILVTAAGADDPPKDLTDQLAVGGLMLIPLGWGAREHRVVCIRRTSEGLTREDLWPVRFVPLISGLPVDPDTPSEDPLA